MVFGMRKLLGLRVRLKLSRLIRGAIMGGMEASLCPGSNEDWEQTKTFNSNACLLARKRVYEIDAQKAMAILESRHDKWKAGGPL